MSETQGRTASGYDDFHVGDGQPCVYKLTDSATGTPRYWGRAPCGHVFQFHDEHIVDENDDDTFTVRPQPTPGAMNSILCRCGWHGYIDHNTWRTV